MRPPGWANRLGRRRRRRTFCVGLPKSGTHSLVGMLQDACRAAHEPQAEELLPLLPRARAGELAQGELRSFFRSRAERLDLDVESNHLLASFLPHLLDAFPTAGVVLLVRECRSWIDSMINDQLNLRQWDGYSRWQVVYDSYMVPAPAEAFPPEERTLQELGLYPLSHYVRYWREEAEQVRKLASPKRLLELRTGDLADRADEIAAFTGIPAARIDRALSHSYRAPKKHDILARLDPGYVSRALGSEA